MNGMPGLTLHPEWCWAIDLPGPLAKRVENRTWAPPKHLVGPDAPWIALHAGAHIGGRSGKVATEEGLEGVGEMAEAAGLQARTWGGSRLQILNAGGILLADTYTKPIVTRAITGLIRVTHISAPGSQTQAHGVYGWKVPDAIGWVFEYRRLPTPVPCKGAQGLWTVDVATEEAITLQLAAGQTA